MSKPKHKNEEIFTRYLREDEDIQWTGKPNPYRLFHKNDVWVIPLGIAFLAISFGFALSIYRLRHPITIFVMLLYLGIGFLFLFGRFYIKFNQRISTFYAVTNERALIVRMGLSQKLDTIFLSAIHSMNLQQHRDNSGTILFNTDEVASNKPDFLDNRDFGIGFYEIEDVQFVYMLINKLQQ